MKTSLSRRYHQKLSFQRWQRGDTIVEVLIAIAIISLVLTGAFSTTHASLLATRTSQEHSEALKLLEGQIESIRSYNLAPPSPTATEPFCVDGTATQHQAKFGASVTIPGSTAADTLSDTIYPAACRQTGATGETYKYFVSIVYNPSSSTYDLRARWDGFNGSHNQVELFYRYPDATSAQTLAVVGAGGATCATASTAALNVIPPGDGTPDFQHGWDLYYSTNLSYSVAAPASVANNPPGCNKYQVTIATADRGHPEQPTDTQPNEKLFAVFMKGGTVLATTGLTNDIPNSATTVTTNVGTVTLAQNPDTIVFKHYSQWPGAANATASPNSVEIVSIVMTPQ